MTKLIYDYVTKDKKYKNILEKHKKKIEKLFIEVENNYLIDFEQYKAIFFNTFNKQYEINQKEIMIESDKWESIKKEYEKQRNSVLTKINSLIEKPNDLGVLKKSK